jgi:hypothetical protein
MTVLGENWQSMLNRTSDLILRDVVATGASYAGRKLGSFEAIGCTFTRCDFSNLKAQAVKFGAGATMTIYRDCVFDGSKLARVSGGAARFERCSFERVDISKFRCEPTEFIDCTFSGRLHGGYSNGTPSPDWQQRLGRASNEFRGNDFSRAELVDIGFRTGVDLSLQRLPVDPGKYLYSEAPRARLQMLREQFLSWTDLERRRQAFAALAMLEEELANGQQQLFLCKDSLAVFDTEVTGRIYAELGAAVN